MKKMKSILLIAVLALIGIGTIGCETTEGAGRDIQHLGEGIEDTAR